MTENPGFMGLRDDLTQAAQIMWQRDCGVVPVVDDEGRVVGLITDRDICIAVASRNQRSSEILASDLIHREPVSCRADEDLNDVLKIMKKYRVRRLPVVNELGRLEGVISLADILVKGGKDKSLRKRAYSVLKWIVSPEPIVLREESVSVPDAAPVEEEPESDLLDAV